MLETYNQRRTSPFAMRGLLGTKYECPYTNTYETHSHMKGSLTFIPLKTHIHIIEMFAYVICMCMYIFRSMNVCERFICEYVICVDASISHMWM